jgi:hypothetical protein
MVADADRPGAGWSHKTFALAALIVASAAIARVHAAPGVVMASGALSFGLTEGAVRRIGNSSWFFGSVR